MNIFLVETFPEAREPSVGTRNRMLTLHASEARSHTLSPYPILGCPLMQRDLTAKHAIALIRQAQAVLNTDIPKEKTPLGHLDQTHAERAMETLSLVAAKPSHIDTVIRAVFALNDVTEPTMRALAKKELISFFFTTAQKLETAGFAITQSMDLLLSSLPQFQLTKETRSQLMQTFFFICAASNCAENRDAAIRNIRVLVDSDDAEIHQQASLLLKVIIQSNPDRPTRYNALLCFHAINREVKNNKQSKAELVLWKKLFEEHDKSPFLSQEQETQAVELRVALISNLNAQSDFDSFLKNFELPHVLYAVAQKTTDTHLALKIILHLLSATEDEIEAGINMNVVFKILETKKTLLSEFISHVRHVSHLWDPQFTCKILQLLALVTYASTNSDLRNQSLAGIKDIFLTINDPNLRDCATTALTFAAATSPDSALRKCAFNILHDHHSAFTLQKRLIYYQQVVTDSPHEETRSIVMNQIISLVTHMNASTILADLYQSILQKKLSEENYIYAIDLIRTIADPWAHSPFQPGSFFYALQMEAAHYLLVLSRNVHLLQMARERARSQFKLLIERHPEMLKVLQANLKDSSRAEALRMHDLDILETIISFNDNKTLSELAKDILIHLSLPGDTSLGQRYFSVLLQLVKKRDQQFISIAFSLLKLALQVDDSNNREFLIRQIVNNVTLINPTQLLEQLEGERTNCKEALTLIYHISKLAVSPTTKSQAQELFDKIKVTFPIDSLPR